MARVRCGNCGAHPVSVEHVRMCYRSARENAGIITRKSERPSHSTSHTGSLSVQQFRLSDAQITKTISSLVERVKNAGELSPYIPSRLYSFIEQCQWFVPFCINCNSEITFFTHFHKSSGVFFHSPAELTAWTRCTPDCPRNGNNLRDWMREHNPFERTDGEQHYSILDRPYVEVFFGPFPEVSISAVVDGKSASVRISNPFRDVPTQLATDAAGQSPGENSVDFRRHKEIVAELLERNEEGRAASNSTGSLRDVWFQVDEEEFRLLALQVTADRFFVFEVARERYDIYFHELSNRKAPYTFDELIELVLWMENQSNDFCKSVVAFFFANAFLTPKQFEAAANLKNPRVAQDDGDDDYYEGPSDREVIREMAAEYGWESAHHFLDSLDL